MASEAAADYLAERYNDGKTAINPQTGQFDPNLLPEGAKTQIRDLTAAIGAVVGGTVGDSAFNAQLAGVVGQNAVENNGLTIFPVHPDRMAAAQSLAEYGIENGWSDKKLQEEVNKSLRGNGVEITNEDAVEVLDKAGKVSTIIGAYPSPYTKPIGAAGAALGTLSILVDNKKTQEQKVLEIFGSALGSFGSGAVLKNVPVSQGAKNIHNAISGEIGGKAGEAIYQCKQDPKQPGC